MSKHNTPSSSGSKSSKRPKVNYEFEENSDNEFVYLFNGNVSGNSDSDSCSDLYDAAASTSADAKVIVPNVSYRKVYDHYTENQKRLEVDHVYDWNDGEMVHSGNLEQTILLSDAVKKKIHESTPTEIFDMFFSQELKQYIIDATKENGFDLSLDVFETFVGILILTSYNTRQATTDYWSKEDVLRCDIVARAMSRNKFQDIKSKLKFAKSSDQSDTDKVWKVRSIMNIFRQNILQFGFFGTALSIDEMMIKFFGRTCLKQFVHMKPVRFGIKIWAVCTTEGFLLDFEIYCGKNDTATDQKLNLCPLGSRVVMKMVNKLLLSVSKRKVSMYHIYFDNFFTSPDLVLHLMKNGLRSTGTVRKDRIKKKHVFDKKSLRGSFQVSHDKNSGINFISIIDSKEISLLSTATGVTPMTPLERTCKVEKKKKAIDFPHVISLYNKYMGGVDLHDYRCNTVAPSIRSKKWTWVIFTRIIQAAIVNAIIIYNICRSDKKQATTKEFAVQISKDKLKKTRLGNLKDHKSETRTRSVCAATTCPIRTTSFYSDCNCYFCVKCFRELHNIDIL